MPWEFLSRKMNGYSLIPHQKSFVRQHDLSKI